MRNWFANLFSPRRRIPATDLPNAQQIESLTLTKDHEIQSLKLDLRERDETIQKLRQEIERLQARQEETIAEHLEKRMGALFSDLASPASQILTQEFLLEKEQKPIQARDVLIVARRIVRSLERHGLVFEGKAGEQTAFDPNRHTPIAAGDHPQAGQPVTVRFAGTSYAGRIITKAGVE